MAVQQTPSYRDDTFQQLANFLDDRDLNCDFMVDLLNFEVDDPGIYPVPAGVQVGNLRDLVRAKTVDPATIACRTIRNPARSAGLFRRLEQLKNPFFGLHGVYTYLDRHWEDIFDATAGPVSKSEAEFYKHAYAFSGAASYRTASDVKTKSEWTYEHIHKFVVPAQQYVRAIIKVISQGAKGSNAFAARLNDVNDQPLERLLIRGTGIFNTKDVYFYKGVLIINDTIREQCYVFGRHDIERLEKLIVGIAHYRCYMYSYDEPKTVLARTLGPAADQILKILRNAIGSATKDRCNDICRAFDITYNTYLATVSADVNTRAISEQQAKWQKGLYGNVLNQTGVLEAVRPFHFKEAVNLLLVHKALPAPDFCYFSMARKQQDKYDKVKHHGQAVQNEVTGSYEDLWRYVKLSIITSHYEMNGVCPGYVSEPDPDHKWQLQYPHCNPHTINFRQLDKVVMTSTLKYKAHDVDILDMVKDKAVCSTKIRDFRNASDKQKAPLVSKNQLVNAMMRSDPISMLNVRQNEATIDYDVEADDKAEAKKRDGRWFFSAMPEARLRQSEYENACAQYAKNMPGCLANRSYGEKVRAMNHITKPVPGQTASQLLLLSFDIDSFSPSMPIDIHTRLDNIWGDGFGAEDVKHANRIFTDGNIHYIKRNIHHVVPKQGRDFEGFAGRKLTMYHCAVMGYAVRRLRELKLISEGARFASFIDDGLLRIYRQEGITSAQAQEILNVIESVYRMAGLTIAWDKTFVSQHFAVFLNEIRYDGSSVAPGVRAYMRVTNKPDSYCPSIIDDLEILESTIRGSISSGTQVHVANALYLYYIMDIFKKWGKDQVHFGNSLALAAFTPVALGGFGVKNSLALEGSIAADPFVEGIGILRAIAVRFKPMVLPINRIVNQKMSPISAEQRVRAPTSVRRADRIIRGTRGRIAVERALKAKLQSPVILALFGSVQTVHADITLAAATVHKPLPVPLTDLVWKSTLDHGFSVVAGKFLRSRTAFQFVSRRTLSRCFMANFTEAKALISLYK